MYHLVLDPKDDAETNARALVNYVISLGFTPQSHPGIIRDMHRAYKEAEARAGLDLEVPRIVRWVFEQDGTVTAEVMGKED